jgi:carboxylesterase type B
MDGTEDCLTLDIFTPQVPYFNPIPVVVLIGAESISGGSPGALRATARLARERDVVFVRPNFRLGVMGFLASEIIKKEIHPPTSGNYGLSDIVVALKWIHMNIEHFGGDKQSVTLLGHRAGGTLVTALTASR